MTSPVSSQCQSVTCISRRSVSISRVAFCCQPLFLFSSPKVLCPVSIEQAPHPSLNIFLGFAGRVVEESSGRSSEMAEEAKNTGAEAVPTNDIAEEKTAAPAPEVTLVMVESKTSF